MRWVAHHIQAAPLDPAVVSQLAVPKVRVGYFSAQGGLHGLMSSQGQELLWRVLLAELRSGTHGMVQDPDLYVRRGAAVDREGPTLPAGASQHIGATLATAGVDI